jgi:two-component system response regulator QseB
MVRESVTPRARALMLEPARAAPAGQALVQALRMRSIALDRTASAAQLRNAVDGDARCGCVVIDAAALQAHAAFDALRRDLPALPVLVVAAGAGAAERVQWIDRGADDALPAAPDADELAARIAACVRRASVRRTPPDLRLGGLVLQPAQQTVCCNGESVALTPKECALLELLMRAREPLSRSAIHAALGGSDGGERASNLVEVHVHALRRKLGATRIRTVRGAGYRLDVGPARGGR